MTIVYKCGNSDCSGMPDYYSSLIALKVCPGCKKPLTKTMENQTKENHIIVEGKMNKQEILNLIGNFTWLWNDIFFIETAEGNFIWSDPDYGGDNSVKPCKDSYEKFLTTKNISHGRDKGSHIIRDYCGENIELVQL